MGTRLKSDAREYLDVLLHLRLVNLYYYAPTVWPKILICLRWWRFGVFAIPRTNCFKDRRLRTEHFGWHHIDFNARNECEYERMADRFLSLPSKPEFHECRRSGGDD